MSEVIVIFSITDDTLCLTASGSAGRGDRVILSPFLSHPAQHWRYDRSRGTFTCEASGTVLDATRRNDVILWTPTGKPNQQWTYDPDNLHLNSSNGFLDIANRHTPNGSFLSVSGPADVETQCWLLRSIAPATPLYNIAIDGHPEFFLHVQNAVPGAPVVISRPEVSKSQAWAKVNHGSGFVIRSAVNGLALIAGSHGVVLGAEGTAEVWQLSRDGFIWTAASHLFLDTDGHVMNQDVRVVVAPRCDALTQHWDFWNEKC
jgi:hypothetical protein